MHNEQAPLLKAPSSRSRSLFVLGASASLFAFAACASVIGADFDRNGTDAGPAQDQDGAPPSSTDDGATVVVSDGARPADAHAESSTPKPAVDGGTFAAAQTALQALRYPGPLTAQGSTGYCTDNHFIWRESDGTLHSWSGVDQSRIDYTFKQLSTPVFLPGDSYLPIDSAGYAATQIYDTTQASSLITTLPYSYNTAGYSGGMVLLEISGTGTNQATKVQLWNAAMNATGDLLPAVVPTPQPPSSFGLNEVVLPGGVAIPYPLYIVDIVAKTTNSVTFDGAVARYDTLSTPLGLVVSYARTGTFAIRLYQNNNDGTRVEIGDEIANIPPVYPDANIPHEHTFELHISRDGNNLVYASIFGIWSYGLDTGTLTPLQLLGTTTSGSEPDIMCVIPTERLLIYRVNGDSAGQIWVVPLSGLLP